MQHQYGFKEHNILTELIVMLHYLILFAKRLKMRKRTLKGNFMKNVTSETSINNYNLRNENVQFFPPDVQYEVIFVISGLDRFLITKNNKN